MSETNVVNALDWLDEEGWIPADPALRGRAIRMAQAIEYASTLEPDEYRGTMIPCQRQTDGQPCLGFLIVTMMDNYDFVAHCDECNEEEFVITNWQGTAWDEGGDDEDDDDGPSVFATEEVQARFEAALEAIACPLSANRLLGIMSSAESPAVVMEKIMNVTPDPPSQKAVDKFIAVLMDTWNNVRRPELGGKTPAEMRSSGPIVKAASPGRNAPCPCGSGKKYKRCCAN
ncbi:MAG: SEC-C metal-binding domain-containing protein [Deltaproteobacteria bacterium]|nr:SEC-C metal-binding domain-containing protein [Deltaproteobacteria bacterium]